MCWLAGLSIRITKYMTLSYLISKSRQISE